MAPTPVTLGCVIGTFGADEWRSRGEQLLLRKARSDHGFDEILHVHGDTLADARNSGARALIAGGCEAIVFLDADDDLAGGYAAAMRVSLGAHPDAAIHRPATQGLHPDGHLEQPVMIDRTDLTRRNCIVIGAAVRSGAFMQAGGFQEYAALEDWALWRQIVLVHGHQFVDARGAVYIVGVNPESRNDDAAAHREAYRQILREVRA